MLDESLPSRNLPLLEDDLGFFEKNGYLVVKNLIPFIQVKNAQAAIWEYLNAHPDRPDTWYTSPFRLNGVVHLYHHQSFWDNRQQQSIYEVFSQLLGKQALWVSIDRAKMQPPAKSRHCIWHSKGFIHWDINPRNPPKQLVLQGLLCLSKFTPDHGGFQCIPGFHHRLNEWNYLSHMVRSTYVPKFPKKNIHIIEANVGDLIVWSSLLPHGAGCNWSSRPRLAQFIRMFPAGDANEAVLERRLNMWRNGLPNPNEQSNQKSYTPARLSELGQKLLGLRNWD